jgi:hypothetical protein
MGLLDWLKGRSLATAGEEETPPAHRAHRDDVDAPVRPEEPPAGASESGSLAGDEAEGAPGERA